MTTTTLRLDPGRPHARAPGLAFSLSCVRGRAAVAVEGQREVLLAAGESLESDGARPVVVRALEPAELAWAEQRPLAAWLGLTGRRAVLAALAAVYLIWGSTYFAIAAGIRHVPPLTFAGARFLLAGALLAGLAYVRREAWPSARQAARGAGVGLLLFVVGNGGVTLAEAEVSSGLTAVVVASMPIWLAVFASLTGERPSRREALGLLLGLGGVMALYAGAGLGGSTRAATVLFASPIGWALGSLLSRRWALGGSAAQLAAQMLPAGAVLSALGALTGESPPATVAPQAVIALVYLVVFGSLVGVSAYAFLLRATRPALATSYATVNPMVAVLIGVTLGGETIGPSALLAGALVLSGVALATWRP